jgi:hypothetical protein
MLASHFRAATGFVGVETTEEQRLIVSAIREFKASVKTFTCMTISAPNGPGRLVHLDGDNLIADDKPSIVPSPGGQPTLFQAYAWAAQGQGRVVFVHDWHMLANNPGHWRAAIEARPSIQKPAGANQLASMIVFIAPEINLENSNPLRNSFPILPFALPTREELATVVKQFDVEATDAVLDSLSGVSAATADQAVAECLVYHNGKLEPTHLRKSRERALKAAGLELWEPVADLGGLERFKSTLQKEVIPWSRDPMLGCRRILAAGVPGVGKSYGARYLAHLLGCECARLSIPSLKAGLVGASERNLRRALAAVDAMAPDSPLVVVFDEIDGIPRDGLDGGASSGMFSELLTWLQESTSKAIAFATLNHLDHLDAAISSRFPMAFFFDLPDDVEREEVARIHFARLGCKDPEGAAKTTVDYTPGFSSREIAGSVCPSVARLSDRKPTVSIIKEVCGRISPASKTQEGQLAKMRAAADTLLPANSPKTARRAGRAINN